MAGARFVSSRVCLQTELHDTKSCIPINHNHYNFREQMAVSGPMWGVSDFEYVVYIVYEFALNVRKCSKFVT